MDGPFDINPIYTESRGVSSDMSACRDIIGKYYTYFTVQEVRIPAPARRVLLIVESVLFVTVFGYKF